LFDYHDGYWVYELVKEYIIDKKKPVIVGYFQDWHYCIAFEVAKLKNMGVFEQSYILIDRAWEIPIRIWHG
jgi:hypothetical protein